MPYGISEGARRPQMLPGGGWVYTTVCQGEAFAWPVSVAIFRRSP